MLKLPVEETRLSISNTAPFLCCHQSTHHRAHDPTIEQLTATVHVDEFVKKSFTPGKSNSPLVTSPFSWSASHCKRTAAAAVVLAVSVGKWKTTCCVLLSFLSVAPCFHFSPFLPLRPVLSRALPAQLSWLLATFVDGLAPFGDVVRCPHGSTKRFSTMSCVCSTHRFLRVLNSFLSVLQRISLALSSLLFLRALPGSQLAPPEHRLLSLAPPALSSLPHAPPALSSLPHAPPALSSLPHAPPALSSLPLPSFRVLFLLSSKPGGFSSVSSSCLVSCLVSFSFSCSLSISPSHPFGLSLFFLALFLTF